MRTARVFVSYRRADEPFAAALTASLAAELVGDQEVFVDTLYLRQRGRGFERELLAAVRAARLVLAVVGPAWDDPYHRRRLAEPEDWVRRELEEATAGGTPIVPVLVGREDVPAIPGLRATFDEDRGIVVEPADPARLSDDLRSLLGPEGLAAARRTPRERLEWAIYAMLRHLLPAPQRSAGNDRTIARCVAADLDEGDWLRFVTTGNQPGRPLGSTVLHLTREVLGVVQLDPHLAGSRVQRLPVADVDVARRNRKRLWKPVADLELTAGEVAVSVRGVFADEADDLMRLLGRGEPATG